jgi:hypothetical protein
MSRCPMSVQHSNPIVALWCAKGYFMISSWVVLCVFCLEVVLLEDPIYMARLLMQFFPEAPIFCAWPATHPPRFHSVSDDIWISWGTSSSDVYPGLIRVEISTRPNCFIKWACLSVKRGFMKLSKGISYIRTH